MVERATIAETTIANPKTSAPAAATTDHALPKEVLLVGTATPRVVIIVTPTPTRDHRRHPKPRLSFAILET